MAKTIYKNPPQCITVLKTKLFVGICDLSYIQKETEKLAKRQRMAILSGEYMGNYFLHILKTEKNIYLPI